MEDLISDDEPKDALIEGIVNSEDDDPDIVVKRGWREIRIVMIVKV